MTTSNSTLASSDDDREIGERDKKTLDDKVRNMPEDYFRKILEDKIVKSSDEEVSDGTEDDATVTSEEFDPSRGYRPRWRGTEEYIEDITYRIWEMRNVELIRDTYSESCPVFTLSGISLLLGLEHDLYQYSTVLQVN